MPWYRCYFIDERGKTIETPIELEAAGDIGAIEEARQRCRAHRRCTGGEVWSEGRLVDQFEIGSRRPPPARPSWFWPL